MLLHTQTQLVHPLPLCLQGCTVCLTAYKEKQLVLFLRCNLIQYRGSKVSVLSFLSFCWLKVKIDLRVHLRLWYKVYLKLKITDNTLPSPTVSLWQIIVKVMGKKNAKAPLRNKSVLTFPKRLIQNDWSRNVPLQSVWQDGYPDRDDGLFPVGTAWPLVLHPTLTSSPLNITCLGKMESRFQD